MSKDHRLYIVHILESIEEVKNYAPQETALYESRMAYQATLRVLQTLAESASKLPDAVKQQFSDIPWQDIQRFRNVIVHNYLDDYNRELIWKVITHHLPPLEKAMLLLLPEWKTIKLRKPE